MSEALADVPAGAAQRLSEHYGAAVELWLQEMPGRLVSLAARWQVRVCGYHDAGWASVVAVGYDRAGRPVVLKAIPERSRYRRECAALGHWAGQRVCRLLAADDHAQVLLLESVTARPGGAPRPPDHPARVAGVLAQLHQRRPTADMPVPTLGNYYRDEVVPRIARRAQRWGEAVGPARAAAGLRLSQGLGAIRSGESMLHADLYAENVLFDEQGEPVFIDPHPKIGSSAFDWAFWCVYYTADGFTDRVELCRKQGRAEMDEVLAGAATLVIDGALYCVDAKDHTAAQTLSLLESPTLTPLLGRS